MNAFDTKVVTSIRRVPGSRAVEIAERLGEPVRDVTLALYRLKRAKKVRRKGETRATQYWATKAGV